MKKAKEQSSIATAFSKTNIFPHLPFAQWFDNNSHLVSPSDPFSASISRPPINVTEEEKIEWWVRKRQRADPFYSISTHLDVSASTTSVSRCNPPEIVARCLVLMDQQRPRNSSRVARPGRRNALGELLSLAVDANSEERLGKLAAAEEAKRVERENKEKRKA